jgi:hypothetical protein
MSIAKNLVVPGVAAVAVVVGLAGGSVLNAAPSSADTTTSTGTTSGSSSTSADPADQRDESQGGHVGSNGTKEAVLTGDAAAKAKAAAEAAVPGGTVLRVENDAEGATYEAHVKKSDGTQVTVKMDADFKVTGTESGHGRGGPGNSSSSSTTN